MAVIFEHIEGWFRPRFICDACQQPITEVRNAMVLYEEPDSEAETSLTRILHAHKDEPCQSKSRRAAGHKDGNGMWDELANHIVMLAADVGLFPDGFKEDYEYLLAKGMVPPPSEDD